MSDYTNTGHAIAVLRESAKQHRLAGDDGHARSCDRAAELLDGGVDPVAEGDDLADRGHAWALENYGPNYDGRADTR